jgi:hypothetical protein
LTGSLRVVSLLPSATEMIYFVGTGDSLVGVTHECDYPPGVEDLPKLTSTPIDHHRLSSPEIDAAIGEHPADTGSIYLLDAKLLEELKPDLILTQGHCDGCSGASSAASRLHRVAGPAVLRRPLGPRDGADRRRRGALRRSGRVFRTPYLGGRYTRQLRRSSSSCPAASTQCGS